MSSQQPGLLPAFATVWRRRRGRLLDIRFKPELETSFRDAKIERRRNLISAGLVLAAILQIGFVTLDYVWLGHNLTDWQLALLLSLVTAPHLLFALGVRGSWRPAQVQWATLALVIWSALVISTLLALIPTNRGEIPFAWEATMMLIIFTCVFTGLRFFQVMCLCLLVIVFYLGTQIWSAGDAKALIYALYFLTGISLLALVGEYLLERSERYEFLFRRRLHRHLERDFLTGLTNRRMLYRALKLALDMGRRDRRSIAVAMIDVDDFKEFNDKHGHLGGDRYLRRLGGALRQLVRRPLDCTARFGGDEFCVVWYDVGDDGAESLRAHIQKAVTDAGLPLTVSIGSVLISPDEFRDRDTINRNTADLVLEYADTHLYRAKLARGGGAAVPA